MCVCVCVAAAASLWWVQYQITCFCSSVANGRTPDFNQFFGDQACLTKPAVLVGLMHCAYIQWYLDLNQAGLGSPQDLHRF